MASWPSQQYEAEEGPASLCRVCVDLTGVTGASIVLACGHESQSNAGASDGVSARIEELEFTCGEGPAVDACREDRPVLVPDLADPLTARWFGFTAPAVAAGASAVFSFPLHAGGESFGALSLYRDRPGPLDAEQHADALAMADVAADAVLHMQADALPGAMARELEHSTQLRSVVHQAAGMVSAQLDVGVGEALMRIRGHAFRHNRSLAEVGRAIVDRTLRLDRG